VEERVVLGLKEGTRVLTALNTQLKDAENIVLDSKDAVQESQEIDRVLGQVMGVDHVDEEMEAELDSLMQDELTELPTVPLDLPSVPLDLPSVSVQEPHVADKQALLAE
jgi:hypothetical protein